MNGHFGASCALREQCQGRCVPKWERHPCCQRPRRHAGWHGTKWSRLVSTRYRGHHPLLPVDGCALPRGP